MTLMMLISTSKCSTLLNGTWFCLRKLLTKFNKLFKVRIASKPFSQTYPYTFRDTYQSTIRSQKRKSSSMKSPPLTTLNANTFSKFSLNFPYFLLQAMKNFPNFNSKKVPSISWFTPHSFKSLRFFLKNPLNTKFLNPSKIMNYFIK